MELTTISKVSKLFGISTRTLRYYEEIGLIQSERMNEYAYRVYSEETLTRLKQIVILRKLRIPLAQIAEILNNNDAQLALSVFQESIDTIDEEVTALTTIKSILNTLIEKLNECLRTDVKTNFLENHEITQIVDTLEITKIKLSNEKTTQELQVASENLTRLSDKDVRIIYLPPSYVASAHVFGEDAETVSGKLIDDFIRTSNLQQVYPQSRHYGFNNPEDIPSGPKHGYERYVTIPDDMGVPYPLTKKHFVGGVYAAVTIAFNDWEVWEKFGEWLGNSTTYEWRLDSIEINGTCGAMEEHLNFWNWYVDGLTERENNKFRQIDLLLPIQRKMR